MLRKLLPGETASVALWNALVERIDTLHDAPREFIAAATVAPTAAGAADLRPRGVEFHNDSGLTAPAYGVLRITGFSAADGHRALLAEQPNATLSRSYAVNGPVDVPVGQYGICYLGGLLEALYDGPAPTVGDGYGPQSGQWSLAKNLPGGFSVLGIIDAANQVMACHLAPPSVLIGELAEPISAGASAAVNVWAGTPGSEAALAGVFILAHDWLLEPGLPDTPAGTKVVCQWINAAWYVTTLE